MDKSNTPTEDKNNQLWQEVLSLVARKIRKPSFNTWVKPTKLLAIEAGFATVAVKNEFARNVIGQSHLEALQDALQEATAASLGIRLIVDEEIEFEDEGQASIASIIEENRDEFELPKSEDFDLKFNNQVLNRIRKAETNLITKFSFDNFIVGNCNEFTHKLASAISKNEYEASSVFISSEEGLGKTHIINAIGNQLVASDSVKNVRYVKGEQFTNELITSIRSKTTHDFRKKYRNLDLLLLDDVQFFEGKDSSQEEFFHTYNSITDNGGQLVVCANKPVNALSLEPRLKSRLSGNLATELQRPDYDTRVSVLEKVSGAENLGLEESVVDLIAKRFSNNFRELEGAILRLGAYKSFGEADIDDELIVKLFGTYRHGGRFHGLTIEKISKIVASYFGISLNELVGTRRLKDYTKARHLAVYLAYDLLKISYGRIGQYFSNRKHSSIIHSVKLIKSELLKDRSLVLMIDDIKSKFGE